VQAERAVLSSGKGSSSSGHMKKVLLPFLGTKVLKGKKEVEISKW
jgi:hypothetical protein